MEKGSNLRVQVAFLQLDVPTQEVAQPEFVRGVILQVISSLRHRLAARI